MTINKAIILKFWERMSSPITKVHPTKPPYLANFADGQKKIAPDLYIGDELVFMKNRPT